MNVAVSAPNPPISDAMIGITMRATNGDSLFVNITVNRTRIVTNPRIASISALSQVTLKLGSVYF
ncbi:hypothetical protein D3C87_1764490 [compost metagenome]